MERREARRGGGRYGRQIGRETREDERELLEEKEAPCQEAVEAPERRRVRAGRDPRLAVLDVEDKPFKVGGEVGDPEVPECREAGLEVPQAGRRAEEGDVSMVPKDLEAGKLGEDEVIVLRTCI